MIEKGGGDGKFAPTIDPPVKARALPTDASPVVSL